ncbi:MAG: hypothetical protein ACOVLB_06395 [Candidatus Nanopelagicus sp.]
MSYAQFGTIAATDFNALVGGNPVTSSGTLNAVWATGGTTAGYGQTALANVAVGTTVAAPAQWTSLVSNTASAASHQGTSITSVTAPATGGTITYLSAIPTNLTSIYTGRLNAATQGSTTANSVAYPSTWSTAITFTHTVTFASGNAARYFFNAGGQLKVTCSHANTTAGINLLLNNLASNVGTVVMSSPTSGAVTIAATSYNGITKIGGGGTAPTIATNSGYYARTTSNATIFTQTASTGPSGYLGTFISMVAKSNGTQGSNGDAGSVITIYTIWDEVPNGLTAGTGSTTTVTAQAPETTYLGNTWGTISITGTVA